MVGVADDWVTSDTMKLADLRNYHICAKNLEPILNTK